LQQGQLFHRMVQQQLVGLPVEKLARLAVTPDLARWWENYLGYDLKINGYARHPELVLSAPIGTYRLLQNMICSRLCPVRKPSSSTGKRPTNVPGMNGWLPGCRPGLPGFTGSRPGQYLTGGKAIQPEQVEMIYWYADFPSEPARFPYILRNTNAIGMRWLPSSTKSATVGIFPLTGMRRMHLLSISFLLQPRWESWGNRRY